MLWYFAALLAVFVLGATAEHAQTRRLRRQFGSALDAYNAAAFQPVVSLPDSKRILHVLRVAPELISSGRRRAVSVRHSSGRGIAVHEIRADGSFSERGPYFIKLSSGWKPTGRRYLVETETAPGGFAASNPNGGTVSERGVRVLERDTPKYPPASLQEFAALECDQASERRSMLAPPQAFWPRF